MGNLTSNQLSAVMKGQTLRARFEAMNTVKFNRTNIRQVLAESEKAGTKDLDLTSQAVLLRSGRGDAQEALELVTWSVSTQPASRKVVVGSFVKNRQSTLLVHQIAQLKKGDAATIMKDYFGQGGDVLDIAEWLRSAGSILKTGVVPDGNDGWGWITKTVGKVVDAVVKAINTVADAIKAAGKNLADAVSKVTGWVQSKVNEFVEAVLRAGKTVVELLTEAVKKGVDAVKKFVHALYEAGKRAVEILNWAFSKAMNVLQGVLQKLEQLYGSFTSLLIEIAKLAPSRLANIVKALLNIGKRVADFINRLERLAYDMAKRIVQELRKAGKTLNEIMLAVIDKARYVARIVIEAMMGLGHSIKDLLKEVISRTAAQISRLIGAMKDLGTRLSMILDAIAGYAAALARKFMEALRSIWTRIKEILETIAQKAEHVIKTLLIALVGTVKHISEVLKSILADVRAAFRESLIKGLIAIGYSALRLMKEVVKIGASLAAVLFGVILSVVGSHRGLTALERAEAQKVFGSSINLDMVRITDASLAADFIMWLNKNRPFTTMYVITYKSGATLSMDVLIHELTHIWQAVQSGGVYMIEALHSQFFGAGYNLSDADVRNANGKLTNLQREQQAVLVQEYYKSDFEGKSIRLTPDLIRPLAKQVYKSRYTFNPVVLNPIDLTSRLLVNPVVVPGGG